MTSAMEFESSLQLTHFTKNLTDEEKAVLILKSINEFYHIYDREPKYNRSYHPEYELAVRLQELRHRKTRYPALTAFDEYKLLELSSPPIGAKSIKNI